MLMENVTDYIANGKYSLEDKVWEYNGALYMVRNNIKRTSLVLGQIIDFGYEYLLCGNLNDAGELRFLSVPEDSGLFPMYWLLKKTTSVSYQGKYLLVKPSKKEHSDAFESMK